MSSHRVLLVLGNSAGGIARHVAQVTEMLDGDSGIEIDLAGPDDLPVRMPKPVIPLAIPDGMFGHRAAIEALRVILRRGSYDVVHAHGLRASIDAAMAARHVRVPVLSTVHNLVQPEVAGRLNAPLYRRSEALAVRLTGRTFAVSEEIAARLRRAARRHADKIEVLHLGVGDPPPVHKTRAEVRADLGVGANRPLVVAVARLAPQKALHVLIDAAARSRRDPLVVVVGEGPLGDDLRGRARAVAPERVRFLGWRDDVADLVAAADAFCLSSVWEGVPLAAQEAILLGTPVVATDVGGMRELVVDGESGRLVPRGSATALATALDEVLADPELAGGLASAARDRLTAEFSTSAMLARLRAAYSTTVAVA